MGAGYKTKQRQRILDCLLENRQCHITAEDVVDFLKAQGEAVGKATVYRYLEKLVDEGAVRRFFLENGQGACFQIAEGAACHAHFHLKCVGCGCLIHLECAYLNDLQAHILENHHFTIDSSRTVFYGLCETCMAKEKGATGD